MPLTDIDKHGSIQILIVSLLGAYCNRMRIIILILWQSKCSFLLGIVYQLYYLYLPTFKHNNNITT